MKKGSIALKVEWNDRDPFFDRDLENFRVLQVEVAISVGTVLTRGKSLQDQMVRIIRECIADNGVPGFNDPVAFGVNPSPPKNVVRAFRMALY